MCILIGCALCSFLATCLTTVSLDKDMLSANITDAVKQFGAALYATAILTCLAHVEDSCATVF